MADAEQLKILKQGVQTWNEWRGANRVVKIDLNGAELGGANLCGADLRDAGLQQASLSVADLRKADLRDADLFRADLTVANLRRANLRGADLTHANVSDANLFKADLGGAHLLATFFRHASLRKAKLNEADLLEANLSETDLQGADLSGASFLQANLSWANLKRAICVSTIFTHATLVGTNLEQADLTGAHIYGISAWDVELDGAVQNDLVITPHDAPSTITVDDVEVAQFVYLLLNNRRVRSVIDTITSKVVLILGRFKPERKAVLDALREELRRRGYVPVLFDFETPHQTTDETISTLAGMARFVIADLTDAKSILQELRGIVPNRPSLPVQPILLAGQAEPGMFDFFRLFPWVLQTRYYESEPDLLANVTEWVIAPAERRLAAQGGVVGA